MLTKQFEDGINKVNLLGALIDFIDQNYPIPQSEIEQQVDEWLHENRSQILKVARDGAEAAAREILLAKQKE